MPAPSLGTAVLVLLSASSDLFLGRPLPVDAQDTYIQYDDGTAYWVTWGGLYRGTWFNLADWAPAPMTELWASQYWFFHDSSHPWDTASFYSEVYTGGSSGPATQLDQTSVLAFHYAPSIVEYAGPQGIIVGEFFWILVNTEMSVGGWPSTLGDNTPNFTGIAHSYWSDTFITWNPWSPQGGTACDYFIRANVWLFDLDAASWGSIKALFD